MTSCNYLFETEDYTAVKEKIQEITKKEHFEGLEINNYNLEEVEFDKALEDLDTYSFLAPKKIILIDNIELLKDEKSINSLLKYLNNPREDILLIIKATKLDGHLTFTKSLRKLMTVINTEIDPITFVKNKLHGYKLENGVIDLLIAYKGSNITALNNECEKLRAYKSTEKEISKESIKLLVTKNLEDKDKKIFELINYISSRNKKEALKTTKELQEYNIEPLSIIALLDSQIRVLLQVKVLLESHTSKKEITDILKIHPFRVTKAIENSHNYTKEELINFINKLSKLDLNIKKTSLDPAFAIDMLIINL